MMPVSTRPTMLDWHYLMVEVDEFSIRTGWGMAPAWGLIKHQEYGLPDGS